MPRIHCPMPLASGDTLALPPPAARHVQVLRMQPGDSLTLFNGEGGEFEAQVERMGRSDVSVIVGAHHAVEREAPRAIHLVVGMPANERMDWLVEKAAELGAASIQPVLAQRSVLRLQGERAEKKQAHWQAIAIAACEQSGRNRVPQVHAVAALAAWLGALAPTPGESRLLLSLSAQARPVRVAAGDQGPVWLLSGPEGGLAPQEEALATGAGFQYATLGPRVLRSETAPLAALVALTLQE
ncbi:16S rRNA (uracil(1498)-N(3))-methyltransferase [Caenimonas terrae]|uniref:Ribosomal RNA small subunit methyltransferase E n=1 Tax=Caenimonas terrae TaxID=696074 RepID=A0ABW0NAM1_9BURK